MSTMTAHGTKSSFRAASQEVSDLVEVFSLFFGESGVSEVAKKTAKYDKEYQHAVIIIRWIMGAGDDSAFRIIKSMTDDLTDEYKYVLVEYITNCQSTMTSEWAERCQRVIQICRA